MKDALKVDSGEKVGCKEARLGHCSQNPAYFKEKTICLPATFFVIGYGEQWAARVWPRRRRSVAAMWLWESDTDR